MKSLSKTKRIDITLPEKTIDQIDSIWSEFGFSSRSAFLNEAARNFAARLKRARLKKSLRAGYMARAERDKRIDQEMNLLSLELD
jgi:metal-responsive CopG/Arc/MetJ family transcriptional regulator